MGGSTDTVTISFMVANDSGSPPPPPPSSGSLSPNPANVDFGTRTVGSAVAVRTVTVTNTGSSSVAIANISVTGDGFQSTSNSCINLGPSASCDIIVEFMPTSSSSYVGNIRVTSNAGNSQLDIGLTGAGATSTRNITLFWNPSSGSVDGYNVFTGPSETDISTMVADIPTSDIDPNAPEYDMTIENNVRMCFGVAAYNGSGQSGMSNSICTE